MWDRLGPRVGTTRQTAYQHLPFTIYHLLMCQFIGFDYMFSMLGLLKKRKTFFFSFSFSLPTLRIQRKKCD